MKTQAQLARRYRQLNTIRRREGLKGISDRLRRVGSEWLAPRREVLPVLRSDVMAADITRPFQPVIPELLPGQPLTINWITTPPAQGSGGHTTLFRIVRYLEAHGCKNKIYFYDVYGGDHTYHESIVRSYYDFHGALGRVSDGLEDAHAVVATAWPTAYPVFNSRCAGKRFYFVQDFEPHFYPVGSVSFLAESTYRMGFHGISIGQCFASKLRNEFGMLVDCFEYGCDISSYQRLPRAKRTGIVFYARCETSRRGFELGLMALELFAAKRPEVAIHIYGDKMGKLPFAFTDHGHVTPAQLNTIYNSCRAGLSLSFTNVSLVAQEMLASGCIPVVNYTAEVKTDFNSPFVRYVEPYPQKLAVALEEVVTTTDFESLSEEAAASTRFSTWDDAGSKVYDIFKTALENVSPPVRIHS
jgi:hypothetical protein